MSASVVDPLSTWCPHCAEDAGVPCTKDSAGAEAWPRPLARKPHKARVKLALVLTAHADPLLDATWPHHGPCGICAVPGLGARHRVIDSIAGWISADPDVTDGDMAAEFGVSAEAVAVVRGWMVRWPGAWL